MSIEVLIRPDYLCAQCGITLYCSWPFTHVMHPECWIPGACPNEHREYEVEQMPANVKRIK